MLPLSPPLVVATSAMWSFTAKLLCKIARHSLLTPLALLIVSTN
jgi:hypothetical protein